MPEPEKPKAKPNRARMTALAGLLAAVGALAIWLSDCVPGFGIGGGAEEEGAGEPAKPSDASEPEQPPEPPKPQPNTEAKSPSVVKKAPMKLTINARGCLIDGGEPIECKQLCDDLAPFANVDTVVVDAKDGPHGWVVDALDCLSGQKLSVSINRE